ncbi:dTDP-4-amino-4,6-dideoxygalactose transaminase [Pseudomonas sp. R11F]|uniref:dTDP-4-amino-4,6-dideoxygalactose transaminase n=1 Tax=Pseudomonas palleroniana TaxID=191390 RepID=A0A2L1JJ83_9PSED|nr:MULTISPECIES: dTDP-4-amino-4,6-dideoxygalactose transaminase [Pseudomonas]AVE08553.1 dTDP-4-amino-4,6-dideoxygalactose transaminase [Pseudomonas palleroniana]NCE85346.1 dTDP-4-amino-4,6-dideoxygalactose transaminase [Pseudomonas sp. Q1]UOK37168.1 dTDP-4-amino-4,6-dideoxygalactose transaminase [Pseudomonas palleroniana]UOP09274.1 dTDP-4-amino-4,6-dideoxygalactose transaminase [Pseudomonas palleroniana]
MKIPFNKPPYTGNEDQYVTQAMRSAKMSGDGDFTVSCQRWFEETFSCEKALLTPSCTQALEMAAILIDIQPGDEVIMPSFTFVSTANAFVLRGAKIVFVDIRPDTMNIDETLIEAAITENTKAIVPVHYAGIACEMDVIMDIAQRHGLFVVEDAAQGMMSTYKGRKLGTIGHLAAYSFHETKNYTSGGEGGLLLINDKRFIGRAEIIREKGTNRSQFFRGMIDKYTWVDIGSSYLPGELQAAYLFGQLERADVINDFRLSVWQRYNASLSGLVAEGLIETPTTPSDCVGNAHMFYIKVKNIKARTACIKHLNAAGVGAVFHYVPLHSAPAGVVLGRFAGEDRFTTQESERLIRLPIWYGMSDAEVQHVIDSVIGAVDAAGR